MIVEFLGKAADIYEDIAEKRKLDVAKVIGVVRDLNERQAVRNYSVRSTDAEREIVAQELPKMHPDTLARMDAKQIHAELTAMGVSLRKNQGVLSVISRARKEMLLGSRPAAVAAE